MIAATLTQIRPEQNLLKAKIDSFNAVCNTPDGAAWMMKALHPADVSISGVAMPDGTSYDTVPIELTVTKTIGPDLLGPIPSTWGLDCALMPHPTCPLICIPTGGAHPLLDSVDVRMTPFLGATFDDDINILTGIAQAWRLCGASVTIHLDANATKDSGTIVAAQQVTKADACNFDGSVTLGRGHPPYIAFWPADVPSYDQMMALPRTYQSNLRTGLYMPLKLTQTSQHWFGYRDRVGLAASSLISFSPSNMGFYALGAVNTPAWPFYHLTAAKTDAGQGAIVGGNTSCFMGDNFGHISIAGVDPSSSVVFKVRLLLELKVQAVSSYAPHLRPPPMMDNSAISNYFKIVRELPDAYPADYNDGGKILNTISGVIKKIAPFLGMIPGWGPAITAAAGPITGLLDMGSNALMSKTARKAQKRQNKNQAFMVPNYTAPSPPSEMVVVERKQKQKVKKPRPAMKYRVVKRTGR